MAATSNVKERAIRSGATRGLVAWKPFRGTPRYPTLSPARFVATYLSQRSERRRGLSNNALKLTKRGRFLVGALRAPSSSSRASQLSAVLGLPCGTPVGAGE